MTLRAGFSPQQVYQIEAKTEDNIRKELQQQSISVLGFESSIMRTVVFVTDQGANIVAALHPFQHLDCQDYLNTVLRQALNPNEFAEAVPEVAETL